LPARDSRFRVIGDLKDALDYAPDHPDHDRAFLHRQLNEELNVLEIAASNLIDFPDEPWPLRMAIARQAADEARHAAALRRLLEARGGHVGEFPISNVLFDIVVAIPALVGRLAVSNRSFEASAIDAIVDGMNAGGHRDDAEFMALFDHLLADELQHVRFANVWIRTLTERDGPRAVLALARAVAHADAAFKRAFGDSAVAYPVAAEMRRQAGFTENEIETARGFVDQQAAGG
jgi:uncharacterized ferritin-like protein (DUF455 family)